MSNWWYATSVDVEQGSNLVRVRTGDDTRYFERGSCWLKIAGHDAVETNGLITDGSDTFIRLVKDWSGDTDTARRAFAFRTVPDFQGVADKLALNIKASQSVVDNVISKMGTLLTSTDESVVIETAEGDVQVVPWGYLKNTIEAEWAGIQARLDAEEKLRDNAVVYLDFVNNEGKEAADYTINRDDATALIDYSAPDGVSVQTADGRVVFAPANTPAIGWSNGQAVGLVSAPASTNLWVWSEDTTRRALVRAVVNVGDEITCGDIILSELESAEAGFSYIRGDTEVSANGLYGFTMHVKKGSALDFYVRVDNNSRQFNIENKTQSAGAAVNSLAFEELANGVTKIYFAVNVQEGAQQIQIGFLSSAAGQTGWIGGIQVEQGYPTPYIKTEGSQVTRGAVKANTPTAYSSNAISVYCEASDINLGNALTAALFTIGEDTRVTVEILPTARLRAASLSGLGSTSNAFEYTGGTVKALLIVETEQIRYFVNGIKSQSSGDFSSVYSLVEQSLSVGGYSDINHGVTKTSKLIHSSRTFTDAEAIALTTLED